MLRCECCQEETDVLVPVEDRDPMSPYEYELVCRACEEVISVVHMAVWQMPLFTARYKTFYADSVSVVFAAA